jgi:type II secretory ATPase GspE/PulE/Tfp pilus assembly ATPase PilB-like protein
MKFEIKREDLLIRSGLGWKRKIPLVDMESVEVLENHERARLRIRFFGGQEWKSEKLKLEEAQEVADRIQALVAPTEAAAFEALSLPEIRGRLGAMSARPGLRISRLAGFLFDQALYHRASDIHLEGTPEALKVSFRIDGVLHQLGALTRELGDRLLTYLKVESGVASYRNDIPQEGTMRWGIGPGEPTDFRISFLPTRESEKTAVRIFGLDRDQINPAGLGFSRPLLERLLRLLGKPEGMLLLTGPSASGKTTTLYACLRHLQQATRNGVQMVSIEDPVECLIPGVTQVQVDPRRDMTFARLLGNLLRQDAQVIMIGEVRGPETAAIAVQAALTGHLILSTIHAGRAPEVVIRLLDLGIAPFQVASALAGALSQRLLRTVCTHCQQPDAPPEELIREYEKWIPGDAAFRRGTGCDRCYGTGFRGRTAVAELVEVDHSWQELIRSRPTSGEAMAHAVQQGMVPIEQDAAAKAAQGLTTLDEIKRVLG